MPGKDGSADTVSIKEGWAGSGQSKAQATAGTLVDVLLWAVLLEWVLLELCMVNLPAARQMCMVSLPEARQMCGCCWCLVLVACGGAGAGAGTVRCEPLPAD